MIPTPALTVPFIPLSRVPTPLSRIPRVATFLYLLAQPHGGQRSARQNASAGMSENATRSRYRVEAEDAMAAALLRSQGRGSQDRGSQDRGSQDRGSQDRATNARGPMALSVRG